MGARGSISARQDLRPVNGRRLINGTSYSRSTAAPGRSRRVRRYCARGFLGTVGREWSAIRNVARTTATTLWQRGHCGSIVLPATPSRYDSGALQWGQGLNRACIMALDDSRILGPSRPQLGAWLVELARPQGSVACAPSDRPRVATVPCGFSPAMTARNSVVSECISWPVVPVTSWTSSARPSASRPRYDISTLSLSRSHRRRLEGKQATGLPSRRRQEEP